MPLPKLLIDPVDKVVPSGIRSRPAVGPVRRTGPTPFEIPAGLQVSFKEVRELREMSNPRHRGVKTKWLKRLERLSLTAGILALAFYAGARLYKSGYQSYAAYSFDEQLQGRAPSIKGFIVHLWSKAGTSGNLAHTPKRVNGADLLRSMVYAPETLPAKDWSAGRLHAYERASSSPSSGTILGRLEIPSIDLSVMLLQGTDEWTLNRAVGHIEGTALPGQSGNLGIAGHRDGFFRGLKNITPNATIVLTSLQGRFYYRVKGVQIVKSKDVKVLAPTTQPTLTLVTCYPFYYVGNAPKRYVVTAEIIKAESPGEVAADYANSH